MPKEPTDRDTLLDFELPKFKKPEFPSGGGRIVRLVLLAIILLPLLLGSFFTIDPEEVGIILRLGEYRGREHDAGPGLHFKIPFIDRVYKIPVERQLKEEFGFRTAEVGVRSRFVDETLEANMLTGDENAVLVEWVVQYRIEDAYQFLFRVRNLQATFRDMSEAVMRQVVGDRTVNEVVTVGRVEIENEVEERLQELCDQYETGIQVEQVVLQSNNPPDPVKPSFNEVNKAKQDRDRLINEAQAQYNQVIPRAEGQARQTVQQAEGYALDRVNRAEGDAARFSALYAEYRKAPDVTRTRIYLETMGNVLSSAGRKIVIDDDAEGLVPLLNLEAGAAVAATRRGEGGDQ
ncbi:MAG: FtsH protease activity modulator HflK [Acidobacteria bacterium]|nr:MAG: FtsH protease activity modulator HflK [Acidobacteriota bacterium]